jgi:hypothetical protein
MIIDKNQEIFKAFKNKKDYESKVPVEKNKHKISYSKFVKNLKYETVYSRQDS